MPPLRSRTVTHGKNVAGARALLRATGVARQDIGKPIIAAMATSAATGAARDITLIAHPDELARPGELAHRDELARPGELAHPDELARPGELALPDK
jgi:hypothetical protein